MTEHMFWFWEPIIPLSRELSDKVHFSLILPPLSTKVSGRPKNISIWKKVKKYIYNPLIYPFTSEIQKAGLRIRQSMAAFDVLSLPTLVVTSLPFRFVAPLKYVPYLAFTWVNQNYRRPKPRSQVAKLRINFLPFPESSTMKNRRKKKKMMIY